MFLGLRTTIYPAPNLAKAKEWYTAILEIKPYFDQPYYVGFDVGGFELGLIPDKTPGQEGSIVYWGVDDIHETWDKLLDLGATAHEHVGGEIFVAAVVDPFGNLFGIIQNPHFKT